MEEATPNARKIPFSIPVVSVAEHPWRRRSLYQDTTASSKVVGDGSIVSCRRFISRELMRVVPGARGAQTYSAVVGSWRHQMMLWRPGGWQQSASSLMMHALLKLIVAHRWYVFMAILDSETLADECEISTWSAKGCPDCILCSPYPLDDQWGEGIRTKK